MTLGLLDLSLVTLQLIDQLKVYRDASQLWIEDRITPAPSSINVTGLAPDVAHKEPGCQLSLYLFHVAADKFQRNTYPTGGSAHRIPEQPLALTLYFLVSAHSDANKKAFIEEQQAMSIALKFFHEHPRVTATVPLGNREQSLTLTFEPQTADEIGRLWQAFSSPLRLSAVYRVAVALLEPPDPPAPKPVKALPELDAKPMDVIPPSGEVDVPAGADGLATIAITSVVTGEGFATGVTTVSLRALALVETATLHPEAGRFRIIDPTTLELRVPEASPPGRYLVHVQAAPDMPMREIWLVVP